MKMKSSSSSSSTKQMSRRAWNLLRISLLWARKGGLFKNRLMLDQFRTFPKFIKSIATHYHQSKEDQQRSTLYYRERQLSFDETPVIHVKMHRPSSLRFKIPNIPCINSPPVDFDYDFEQDNSYEMYNENVIARKSFLKGAEDEEEEIKEGSESSDCCDEGIDRKADEFIANFYQQMKLQRQISYLRYQEKINGGVN